MKTTSMAVGRACVCIFVLLYNFQIISGKPLFFSDRFWCDLLCEDDDDYDPLTTTATSTSTLGFLDSLFDDPCSDCPPDRPSRNRNQPPVNFMIPPLQQGMNMTWVNRNGMWLMNMVPWGGPGAPGGPGGPGAFGVPPGMNVATTGAPPAATAGPATTAAPAAATTAAGTTAAVTTAAATTAAG